MNKEELLDRLAAEDPEVDPDNLCETPWPEVILKYYALKREHEAFKAALGQETEWTEKRIDQLLILEDLLKECRSINSSNQVLDRLKKIIRLSEELDQDDIYADPPQVDFARFLRGLITKEKDAQDG